MNEEGIKVSARPILVLTCFEMLTFLDVVIKKLWGVVVRNIDWETLIKTTFTFKKTTVRAIQAWKSLIFYGKGLLIMLFLEEVITIICRDLVVWHLAAFSFGSNCRTSSPPTTQLRFKTLKMELASLSRT